MLTLDDLFRRRKERAAAATKAGEAIIEALDTLAPEASVDPDELAMLACMVARDAAGNRAAEELAAVMADTSRPDGQRRNDVSAIVDRLDLGALPARTDAIVHSVISREAGTLSPLRATVVVAAERERWGAVIAALAGGNDRLALAAHLLTSSDMSAEDVLTAARFAHNRADPFASVMQHFAAGAPSDPEPGERTAEDAKAEFVATIAPGGKIRSAAWGSFTGPAISTPLPNAAAIAAFATAPQAA